MTDTEILCCLRRGSPTEPQAGPARAGPALHRTPPWSAGSCCNGEGATLVLVYLFRDRDRATRFAYSTDVTGRNLSLRMPGTNWAFVMAALDQDISEGEKAKCHLRLRGFYVFEK